MHPVVFDKPYKFTPPYLGKGWPKLLQLLTRRQLRKGFAVTEIEFYGTGHLQNSLEAKHGILLAPNHCRPCDPLVVNELCRQVGTVPLVMASAHLFADGGFRAWMLRRAGAFSIYREGMDRQALAAAIDILTRGDRPLLIFPEGVISRHNDRLNSMMEGTAFIARSAAKKRAELPTPGQVVVHPVAIRYHYRGDIERTIHPVLGDIESRLSWRPKKELSSIDRIYRVGEALLSLKELEYLGHALEGTIFERTARLIDHLLVPLEQEWLKGRRESTVVGRVKKLRTAILPDMIQKDLSAAERDRRWQQLADMYLAQQISCYPPDYIASNPTPERLLETVERFEEDLTDNARTHHPMTATVTVGPAILVSPERERGAAEDPVMSALEQQLQGMLGIDAAALA